MMNKTMDDTMKQEAPGQTLSFASDYMEGAHPRILERLQKMNYQKMPGYGTDPVSASAADKIRSACHAPQAAVHFLTGGTQTNAIVITSLLAPYQGVIAADTGHISTHEAGAIELRGHKVLTIPHENGKLTASGIHTLAETFFADGNREHMVMPGLICIAHPTEYGTLYSLEELTQIRKVCDNWGLKLYLDGARLAYALACPENDLTLPDLARLCDAFYIGGTKCGALLGEALVLPDPDLIPHFFTIMKQQGALLAKGWIAGLQFDTLFTDHLYEQIGENAFFCASRLRDALREKGYAFHFETPTNQIFLVLENDRMEALSRQVSFSFWEKVDETHTAIRLATSWATTMEDVERLIALL